MQVYNKLVRDRIPEIIHATGRECHIEIMPDEEYREALLEKVLEEAKEVREATEAQLVTEIADLYEVLEAIILANNISSEMLMSVKKQRHEDRGGFEKRIKLVSTE